MPLYFINFECTPVQETTKSFFLYINHCAKKLETKKLGNHSVIKGKWKRSNKKQQWNANVIRSFVFWVCFFGNFFFFFRRVLGNEVGFTFLWYAFGSWTCVGLVMVVLAVMDERTWDVDMVNV